MCAAKKAAKSGKLSPASKGVEPKSPSRRESSLNPLPREEVGESLFIRLQAEKVMKKARLKEKWEGSDGWDFDDLCAVVACELKIASPEQMLTAISTSRGRDQKELKKIGKYAAPPIIEGEEGAETLRPEIYEGLLILGMGTPLIPMRDRSKTTATETLVEDMAELLGVEVKRVYPRNFEAAKKNIRERYAEHMAKEKVREEHAGSPSAKTAVAKTRRTQVSMLHEVFGRLVMEGKAPMRISAEIRGLLTRAGTRLPPPESKSP